jgi:hypothetical protein
MCVSLYILAYQKKILSKAYNIYKKSTKNLSHLDSLSTSTNCKQTAVDNPPQKKFRENSPSTIIQDANQIFMCTIFPISVDQDLLFYEYTPSSSNPFSNFFSRFAKNKKEIQNESYRGHCLQRKKKRL